MLCSSSTLTGFNTREETIAGFLQTYLGLGMRLGGIASVLWSRCFWLAGSKITRQDLTCCQSRSTWLTSFCMLLCSLSALFPRFNLRASSRTLWFGTLSGITPENFTLVSGSCSLSIDKLITYLVLLSFRIYLSSLKDLRLRSERVSEGSRSLACEFRLKNATGT